MKNTVPRGTARAVLVIIDQPFWLIGFDHILPCISRTYALRSRRSQGLASWAITGVVMASIAAAQRIFVRVDISAPMGLCACRTGRGWGYGGFPAGFQRGRRLAGSSPPCETRVTGRDSGESVHPPIILVDSAASGPQACRAYSFKQSDVPDPGFVHLHVHSSYSLLEGALTIGKLAELAKADRQPAL